MFTIVSAVLCFMGAFLLLFAILSFLTSDYDSSECFISIVIAVMLMMPIGSHMFLLDRQGDDIYTGKITHTVDMLHSNSGSFVMRTSICAERRFYMTPVCDDIQIKTYNIKDELKGVD